MSGLTVDQREVIRGRRTVGRPTAGHPPTGSNDGERSDENTSIVGDNTPQTSQESPGSTESNNSTALSKKFKLHIHGPDAGLTAVATLNNPWPNNEWGSKKVADLRRVFDPHVTNEHEFCLGDKSLVPEDMLVVDYFEDTVPVLDPDEKTGTGTGDAEKSLLLLETPSLTPPAHNLVYIKAKPATQAAKTTAEDALKKAFMLKFIDKTRETSTTSIQSSDLSADISKAQLGALRPFINMSSDRSRHEFCLDDGTSVSDTMLLKTYVSKGDVPNDIDSDLPILTVYFQKVGRKSIFAEASEEMKNLGKLDLKPDLTLDPGNTKPVTIGDMTTKAPDLSKQGFQESFLNSLADVKATKYLTPAELDEMQWDTVLGNCNVMYGWKFDLKTMSVKRAPQPAFQLRKGLNLSKESDTQPSEERGSLKVEVVKSTADVKNNKAEAKDGGENGEDGGEDGREEGGEEDEDEEGGEEDEGEEAKDKDKKDSPANGFISKRKKPHALPSFCVVDDSKIEITIVSSTLEESMAKNNFTASSFEERIPNAKRRERGNQSTDVDTLMIGNYRFPRASVFLRAEDLEPTEGLSAAIEKVRVTKSLDYLRELYDTFGHFFCEEILIGGRLQTTRATKISAKYSESRAKSQFKTQVGVAVSVPQVASFNSKFSTEEGGEEEKSQQKIHASDSITFEATGGNTILASNPPRWTESVLDYRNWRVIERGELTPLAQVLGRCSNSDVRQARAWFTQAVPFLSKYISIPESRVVQVRLKVNSKIPGLNRYQGQVFDSDVCHYLGHQYGKYVRPIRIGLDLTETVREQLRDKAPATTNKLSPLDALTMLTPGGLIYQGAKLIGDAAVTSDISMVFKEVSTIEEIPLFTPARIQAPVALQYDESHLATGVTDDQYRETVWNMIVPYGEWLQHDSLVMLTSAAGKKNKDNVWLTVYRNAQGHFMPAMTSSGDASFWRVQKREDGKGADISESNSISLVWRFSDQTAGFRDFFDDSFGRRTFKKPKDVKEDELHLKLPFPGFQNTKAKQRSELESDGLAMIMSQIGRDEAFLQPLAISSKLSEGSQKATYNLHAANFRIDLVGNNGLGELQDYMTLGLDQSLTQTFQDVLSQRTETIKKAKELDDVIDNVMDKVDQIGSALLGPVFPIVSSPAKTIISKAAGFFKGLFS
ncbi:hypothetical protein RAB80_003755 [Fusarium oxysporum f. sp. vasinfectum]|nr:hypothetical protein RAB80_003755 [Fusarium oxysporum f. sp. vasinfectum]